MSVDKTSCDSRGMPTKTKSLTERQEEYLNAYRKEHSIRAVAVVLGVGYKTAGDNLLMIANRLGLKRSKDLLEGFKVPTKARDARTGKRASVNELMELFEKQEYRCALSGIPLTPQDCSCDHIVPVSSGGTDLVDNLQWVSPQVNKAKGSMTNEDFIRMCQRVAEWNR